MRVTDLMNMSKSRAFFVMRRLAVTRRILSVSLVLACTFIVLHGYGQAGELATGSRIAKELVGSSADVILLVVTGMSISGLVYVARINYQVQRDFLAHEVRSSESITKLAGAWKSMVRELEHRPCIDKDRLRKAIREGEDES